MGLRQLPAEPQNLQPPPSALSDAALGRKRSNESNETAPLPLPLLLPWRYTTWHEGGTGSYLVNHLGICFPLNIKQGGCVIQLKSVVNYIESRENVSACRIGIPYLCSCSASSLPESREGPLWIPPFCIKVVPGLSWGQCYRGVPNRLADWHIRQLQVGTTCKRDWDGFGACDILVMQTFSGKHHRRAVRVPTKQVCYPTCAGCREP